MIQDSIELVGYFVEAAAVDPIAAALLVFGYVLIIVPSLVLGTFAVIGIIDWLLPWLG